MLVNCDIGERGPDHATDLELIRWIDIANLACGGHAGDRESVAAFQRLSTKLGVVVSAHLSYPDRENFGRTRIDIPVPELLESLSTQYALLSETETVKFHGALYNESCRNAELAHVLAEWLAGTRCARVITQPGSALALACRDAGITVIAEAFAERRYHLDTRSGVVSLVPRDRAYANIYEVAEAVRQVEGIIRRGEVPVVVDEGETHSQHARLRAETICLHSDSVIAIPLARELSRLIHA